MSGVVRGVARFAGRVGAFVIYALVALVIALTLSDIFPDLTNAILGLWAVSLLGIAWLTNDRGDRGDETGRPPPRGAGPAVPVRRETDGGTAEAETRSDMVDVVVGTMFLMGVLLFSAMLLRPFFEPVVWVTLSLALTVLARGWISYAT